MLLAALGCGCPTGRGPAPTDGDGGPDPASDAADDAAFEIDDVPADAHDAAAQDGLADGAADTQDDCEYVGVQVECDPWTPDYVPPPEWEPPVVDCGPGCRQVSWGAYRVSVWDRRAVLMRGRIIFAVDLDSLEHRQVLCEYAPVPVPPLRNVSRDVVYDVGLAEGGAGILYARWVRIPDSATCDWLTEIRIASWDSGVNGLLQTVRLTNPAIAETTCQAGDVDAVEAFGATGAYIMVAPDCWSYLFGIDLETGAVRRYDGSPGGLFISNVWAGKVALATPGEVYLVDLETGARTNLSNHPADQTLPWLHQDRVVWADFRHAPRGFGYSRWFDVYWHDTATGESRRATSGTTAMFSPRIFGGFVVWTDVRDSTNLGDTYPDADVWMYDIRTGEERQVTELPGTEYDLQLWAERVYFRWRRPGVIRVMDEALCECPLPGGGI